MGKEEGFKPTDLLYIIPFVGAALIVTFWVYKGISMPSSSPQPHIETTRQANVKPVQLEHENRKSDYVVIKREPGEDFKAFAQEFVEQLHTKVKGFSTKYSLDLRKSENLLVPYAGVIDITHFEVKYYVKFYFQGKVGDWKYVQTRGQYIVLGGQWYNEIESNHVRTFHDAANLCMKEISTW